jgi:hypothetical protein
MHPLHDGVLSAQIAGIHFAGIGGSGDLDTHSDTVGSLSLKSRDHSQCKIIGVLQVDLCPYAILHSRNPQWFPILQLANPIDPPEADNQHLLQDSGHPGRPHHHHGGGHSSLAVGRGADLLARTGKDRNVPGSVPTDLLGHVRGQDEQERDPQDVDSQQGSAADGRTGSQLLLLGSVHPALPRQRVPPDNNSGQPHDRHPGRSSPSGPAVGKAQKGRAHSTVMYLAIFKRSIYALWTSISHIKFLICVLSYSAIFIGITP